LCDGGSAISNDFCTRKVVFAPLIYDVSVDRDDPSLLLAYINFTLPVYSVVDNLDLSIHITDNDGQKHTSIVEDLKRISQNTQNDEVIRLTLRANLSMYSKELIVRFMKPCDVISRDDRRCLQQSFTSIVFDVPLTLIASDELKNIRTIQKIEPYITIAFLSGAIVQMLSTRSRIVWTAVDSFQISYLLIFIHFDLPANAHEYLRLFARSRLNMLNFFLDLTPRDAQIRVPIPFKEENFTRGFFSEALPLTVIISLALVLKFFISVLNPSCFHTFIGKIELKVSEAALKSITVFCLPVSLALSCN
jgi:hypothetical protein